MEALLNNIFMGFGLVALVFMVWSAVWFPVDLVSAGRLPRRTRVLLTLLIVVLMPVLGSFVGSS
jgi:hypothetical protein